MGTQHVAQQHGGAVLGGRGEDVVVVLGAGEVDHRGAGLEGRLGHDGGVGLHRDRHAGRGQLGHHGHELGDLLRVVDAPPAVDHGLGADVDQVGALRGQHQPAAHGGLGGVGDALAVPGVLREVDDAHHQRPPAGVVGGAADPQRGHGEVEVVGVLAGQGGERGERDHGVSPGARGQVAQHQALSPSITWCSSNGRGPRGSWCAGRPRCGEGGGEGDVGLVDQPGLHQPAQQGRAALADDAPQAPALRATSRSSPAARTRTGSARRRRARGPSPARRGRRRGR